MRKTLRPLVCVMLLALVAGPASACPHCDEGIRKRVRAGIFDAAFWPNVAYSVLPFAVFGGVAAAIHGGPTAKGRR